MDRIKEGKEELLRENRSPGMEACLEGIERDFPQEEYSLFWLWEKYNSFLRPGITEEEKLEIGKIFNSFGKMKIVPEKLIDAGIAPASFTQSVLEREEITSTSFDNKVAIPHSILCSTSRNCSYVIVNKTPMKWGYFEVNIIIMIGINHNQRRFFKELYSNLLEKLQDMTIIQELIKVKSYDAFIKLLTGEC